MVSATKAYRNPAPGSGTLAFGSVISTSAYDAAVSPRSNAASTFLRN